MRLVEPLVLPLTLVTVPGLTSANKAGVSRVRPVVIPEATTFVMLAVWPTSVKSTSVKVTGMEAVSAGLAVPALTPVRYFPIK